MHIRRREYNIKMNITKTTGYQLNTSELRPHIVAEYSEYSNELSSSIKGKFIDQLQ